MAETSPFMTMLQSIPLLITLQERLFQNRIHPMMTYMTYIWYIDICDILLIQGFWHPSRHRPGAWYNNNKLVEFFCFYLIIAIMEKLVDILCFYFINIYLGKKVGWWSWLELPLVSLFLLSWFSHCIDNGGTSGGPYSCMNVSCMYNIHNIHCIFFCI